MKKNELFLLITGILAFVADIITIWSVLKWTPSTSDSELPNTVVTLSFVLYIYAWGIISWFSFEKLYFKSTPKNVLSLIIRTVTFIGLFTFIVFLLLSASFISKDTTMAELSHPLWLFVILDLFISMTILLFFTLKYPDLDI